MELGQMNSLIETGIISFITALAGAYSGAWGAQAIIGKIKDRETLTKEIRNINAAIIVTYEICNFYLSSKQQFQGRKIKFDAAKKAYENLQYAQSTERHSLQLDIEIMPRFFLPIEVLREQLFEKITPGNQVLRLFVTLNNRIHSLNHCIEQINASIASFKERLPLSDKEQLEWYLGLENEHGTTDRTYPSFIEHIYADIDDCISCSRILYEKLVGHGEKLRDTCKNKVRKKLRKIETVNFADIDAGDLMPDLKKYADNLKIDFEWPVVSVASKDKHRRWWEFERTVRK